MTSTLTDLLPRVRAIVDGATKGPWMADQYGDGIDGIVRFPFGKDTEILSMDDAKYIALHDPEITAALWDVVKAARVYYEEDNHGDYRYPDYTGSRKESWHEIDRALSHLTTILARKLEENGR